MDEMRYRKPSVKTVLGVTKMKKRIRKALGINKILAPFRAVKNYQRRMLRRAGYYSPEMKMLRAAKHGQVPGPIGPLQLEESHQPGKHQPGAESVLLAAALTTGRGTDHPGGQKQQGSGLAEAMLLATALQRPNHEQEEEDSKKTTRTPDTAARRKQAKK